MWLGSTSRVFFATIMWVISRSHSGIDEVWWGDMLHGLVKSLLFLRSIVPPSSG